MLKTIQKVTGLLFVSLLFHSFVAAASDLEKEKRWADQVVDAILDGEAIWLDDDDHKFLGIYTESEESSSRAVIIMHGTGIHPDWQQVIQPLRVGLTEHNWDTLSIQMPILANEAAVVEYAPLYDEVAPRIDASIKFLNANGINEIVLIGHSQGASMVAYYLSTSKQNIKGFVGIGMPVSTEDSRMDSVNSLRKVQVPVLDLYGTEDLDNIIASADDRVAAAKRSGNENYVQMVIPGNHFFDDSEDVLVTTVAEWLAARVDP